MITILAIGIGGFIGAILRYSLSGLVQNSISKSHLTLLPIGTFVVNIVGCFLLGFLNDFFTDRLVDPFYKILINVGILGAFTTFSTFSLETINLIEDNKLMWALVNIFLSCTVGLLFLWFGKVFYRLIY